ncbi:hypothetical protein DRO38_02615 [Candidatus Bathyarchaeota archaeon]|nr:MAG: hypothetical protein DRO38_02615 [Candidatus Bathyarchaeota archaeon]
MISSGSEKQIKAIQINFIAVYSAFRSLAPPIMKRIKIAGSLKTTSLFVHYIKIKSRTNGRVRAY